MSDPADPRPSRPPEPDAADCCGEGCVNCVFDIHEAALAKYEIELAAWRARHPDDARARCGGSDPRTQADASIRGMDADRR